MHNQILEGYALDLNVLTFRKFTWTAVVLIEW
jgi:hypothetical protein